MPGWDRCDCGGCDIRRGRGGFRVVRVARACLRGVGSVWVCGFAGRVQPGLVVQLRGGWVVVSCVGGRVWLSGCARLRRLGSEFVCWRRFVWRPCDV